MKRPIDPPLSRLEKIQLFRAFVSLLHLAATVYQLASG
jgi:hypothetical protein